MAVSGKLEFDGKPAHIRIDATSVNGVTKRSRRMWLASI